MGVFWETPLPLNKNLIRWGQLPEDTVNAYYGYLSGYHPRGSFLEPGWRDSGTISTPALANTPLLYATFSFVPPRYAVCAPLSWDEGSSASALIPICASCALR